MNKLIQLFCIIFFVIGSLRANEGVYFYTSVLDSYDQYQMRMVEQSDSFLAFDRNLIVYQKASGTELGRSIPHVSVIKKGADSKLLFAHQYNELNRHFGDISINEKGILHFVSIDNVSGEVLREWAFRVIYDLEESSFSVVNLDR